MGSYTMNLTVHKEGEEGTMLLDAQTGKILTAIDERPDWAEGLTTALVQERLSFYEKRFGPNSKDFETIKSNTQATEFSDLGWIGVDANGDEREIFHDPAYRSEVVAKCLGIDTESGEFTNGTILAEREVSRETRGMTQTQIQEMEDAQAQGFTGETARQQTLRERQAAAQR